MAIAVTDLGTVEDTGADNQSTFSFGSFGTEASDRYLVALVTARDAASATISSVTIGGTSATVTQVASSTVAVQAALAIALVPTGSSGDVVVNWSEDIADDQLCTLLHVTGLSSATAYDTDALENNSNNPDLAGTIDCEAGGIVIAVSANGNSRTSTWSLANEAADQASSDARHNHSVAYEIFASAQTALSVTNTLSGNSANKALAIVAFSPNTGYTLALDTLAFTLTHGDVGLTVQRKLALDTLAYTLTHGDVGLIRALQLPLDTLAYTVTHGDVTFTKGLTLALDTLAYTITHGDVGLTVQRYVQLDGISYLVAHGDVGLLRGLVMSLDGIAYETALGDVAFDYSGWSPATDTGDWTTQTDGATWTVQGNSGSWTVQSNSGTWVIQTDSDGWTVQ